MAHPLSQPETVIWHNSDERFYVEGCGLLHLGASEWLAVVPVIPRHTDPLFSRRADLSRTHIVHSDDGGMSWREVSELPYYSAVPFLHDGDVYLFGFVGGTVFRNDDLFLVRSTDNGLTWSEPTRLFEGHFWNCHTGMVVRDNRLYWAIDDLSFGDPVFRGPCVVIGDLSQDLMDERAWRMSNPVPAPGIPEMLRDPPDSGRAVDARLLDYASREHRFGKYLEPNVIDVYGRLRVLCAVRKTGVCGVLDLTDDGNFASLSFTQYHPMPGGQLKFFVGWDAVSGMFWATANPALNSQAMVDNRIADRLCDGRGLLMLYYSLDGLNWLQAGCVAQVEKPSQSFNYAAWAIDGADLGIIARSNINGPNQHDADCATFHRLRDFRDLAMDLLAST